MSVGTLLAGKSGTVVTIEPGAEVAAAVRSLLQHGIGGLPVVTAHGALVGLVAERDIVKALDDSGGASLSFPVERIMRPPPTCRIDDPLHDVMWRMTRERLRHMVVLRGSHVVGVLSVGDLVKHRLEQLETEAGTLRDYVAAQRALRQTYFDQFPSGELLRVVKQRSGLGLLNMLAAITPVAAQTPAGSEYAERLRAPVCHDSIVTMGRFATSRAGDSADVRAFPVLLSPVLRNSEQIQEMVRRFRLGGAIPAQPSSEYRLVISTVGDVVSRELVNSSGDPRIDERAGIIADSLKFFPALRGGCRIVVHAVVPIVLTAR